jgi:NADP-dependent 3-hydroxy acid dehydrogenase YdfG
MQEYLRVVKANMLAILDGVKFHANGSAQTQQSEVQSSSRRNGPAPHAEANGHPDAPAFNPFAHAGQFLTRTIRHDTYDAINPLAPGQSMKGKYVFISSASGVIGTQTALSFARAGAAGIAITARTASKLDEVEAAIKKAVAGDQVAAKSKNKGASSTGLASGNAEVQVLKIVMDVNDSSSISHATDRTREAFGKVDTIVNLAAHLDAGMISSVDSDEWWRSMETNVRGSYLVVRALLPLLGESKEGEEAKTILNSVSFSAHHAFALSSGYHVSLGRSYSRNNVR